MEYLIITLQFVLSLSILVTLHELGHFFPARLFGMRVEKFYLFFDPWFSIFKFKKGDTTYGIGWLPLGGYVKIAGMIDESMDTEQMNQPAQEWEFRSKPAWQRLVVMLGGVTVNFLLGFFIFAMLLFIYGEKYLPNQNVSHGIMVDEMGQKLGLQNGDKIISVGDKNFDRFTSGFIVSEIVINFASKIKVERNGEQITLSIPDSIASELASYKKPFMTPRVPMVVGDITKKSPSEKAGLQVGDSIIACNGIPTPYFDVLKEEVSRNKNAEIVVTAIRQGKPEHFNLTTTAEGTIGVAPFGPERFFEFETVKYSFLASFPMGVSRGWNFLVTNVKALGQIFTGGRVKASESLGGFVSIAKLFPSTWDWQRFWYMTAILSLILGFMNLLPIPALDGGHAVFLLIEMVIRRPVNQKIMEYAQVVGFVILIALLIYANGLDIFRAFKGG